MNTNSETEPHAAPTGSAETWHEWWTAARDDVEMLGQGWSRSLLTLLSVVLWTGVVVWGIASGAVGILMQAHKQQTRSS